MPDVQGTQSGNKVRDGAEGQTSVFVDMYRRLTSGEIDTFGKLCEYIEKKKNTIDKNLLQEGFFLLKRLNWGAFANITKEKYPRLWKEMVIEDATLREYGELKRNIEISEIYVGVLDIHGYTLFCEKTKKNISMLHRLDGFINNQIVDIAAKYGALARRERGDEIILIGAEPDSTLAACYEIIRIFNKAKDFKSENDGIKSDFHLPPFEISAGIAGGHGHTPLIITEEGLLSGFLINCAARLQSRANTLAPKKTKVIVEQQLIHKIKKLDENRYEILKDKKYFYNGAVSFKGVSLKCYEIFSSNDEFYKFKIEPLFVRLEESVQGNQWQGRVITDMCELVMTTANAMLPFEETLEIDHGKTMQVTNEKIISAAKRLADLFGAGRFSKAFEEFEQLECIVCECKSFEALVREYVMNIYELYKKPIMVYKKLVEASIRENKQKIFTEEELKLYSAFERLKPAHKNLIEKYQDSELINKKSFWHHAIEKCREFMELEIYSGKK